MINKFSVQFVQMYMRLLYRTINWELTLMYNGVAWIKFQMTLVFGKDKLLLNENVWPITDQEIFQSQFEPYILHPTGCLNREISMGPFESVLLSS